MPHCLTDHIGLKVIRWTGDGSKRFISLICPRCRRPSSGEIRRSRSDAPDLDSLVNSELDLTDFSWEVVEFWPQPPGPVIPENLPPEVERTYLQAERNFGIEGNEEAAGTMYGKALDNALRRIDPTLTGMLGPKVKKLAAAGRLTADIAEWCDNIRVIRNDAVHEQEPITRDELEDLRNFTDAVLRYLFSLPGMVKQRRGEKLDW